MHAKDDLGLIPLRGDPSLYIKRNEQDVDGVMGVYVDDSCIAGNENMQQLTEKTLQRFDSKPRVGQLRVLWNLHQNRGAWAL